MSEKEVEFYKQQQKLDNSQKKSDEDLNERLQENQQQKQLNDNKEENEQNIVEENNDQCYNNDSNQVLETFNANNINNNLNLQLQQNSDEIQQNKNNSEYLLSQKNAILGVLGQNNSSSNLQNNFQERQNRISNRLEQKFQTLFEKIENKSPQKNNINNKKQCKSFQSPIRKQDKQEQKSSNYKQFSNNNKNVQNLNDLAQNYNQQSNKILKEKILKQNDIINEVKQNSTLQFQFSPSKKNFRVENQDTINSQYSNKKEEKSDKKQEDLAKKSNLEILLLKSKNQQLSQQSQQFNEDSYRSPVKFTSTKKLGDFSSPKVDLQKQINNDNDVVQNNGENYAFLKQQQQQQNNGHLSNISKLSQQKSPSNYQQKSPSFLEKSKIYSAQRLFTGNSSGNKQISENNDFLSQSRNLNLIQLNSKLSSEKKNQEYIFQSDLEKKNLFDEVQEHIFERKNNFAQKKLDLNIKIDSINNKDIQRENIFFPNQVNNSSRNKSQKNQVKSQILFKQPSQNFKNIQNDKDLSSFSKNFTPNSNLGQYLERKKSSISQNKGLNINNYHKINNNNTFLSPQRIQEREKINEKTFRNRNKSTSYEITVVSSTGRVIQNDNYQVKEKDGKISLKEFMTKRVENSLKNQNFQTRNFGKNLNENQNNQFANNLKELIAGIWQKSDRNQKINNNSKESKQVQASDNFVKNQNSPIKLINKKSTQNMKNQESYGFNNQWDNVVKDFGHTNGNQQNQQKSLQSLQSLDLNELYLKKLKERQLIKKQGLHFKNDILYEQDIENNRSQKFKNTQNLSRQISKKQVNFLNKNSSQSNRLLEEISNLSKNENKTFFKNQDIKQQQLNQQDCQKTFFRKNDENQNFQDYNRNNLSRLRQKSKSLDKNSINYDKFSFFTGKNNQNQGISKLQEILYNRNQNRSRSSKQSQKASQNSFFERKSISRNKSNNNNKNFNSNYYLNFKSDRQISPKRISFVDGFKVKTKNLEKYERDFNNYRNISYNNSFSSANNLSPSRLLTNTSKF